MSDCSQLFAQIRARLEHLEEQMRADYLVFTGRPFTLPAADDDRQAAREESASKTMDNDDELSDMEISDDEANCQDEVKGKGREATIKAKELSDQEQTVLLGDHRPSPRPASDAPSCSSKSRTRTSDSGLYYIPFSASASRPSSSSSVGSEAQANASKSIGTSSPAPTCSSSAVSSRDQDKFFVCGIKGCQTRLPREFFRVRHHVRYTEGHIRERESYEPNDVIFLCPFDSCNFRNEAAMRVTEHVLSDAHFDIGPVCHACGQQFNGRLWSFKRHRYGGNATTPACLCCEGCGGVYDSGVARVKHEERCSKAQEATLARLKRKASEGLEPRVRRKRARE